jgi:hypothetical protein
MRQDTTLPFPTSRPDYSLHAPLDAFADRLLANGEVVAFIKGLCQKGGRNTFNLIRRAAQDWDDGK